MDLPAFQYQQYGDGWNFWASTVNHAEKVIMWMVKKKTGTVVYWGSYIQRYMSYEKGIYWWILLAEARELEASGKIPKDLGYPYLMSLWLQKPWSNITLIAVRCFKNERKLKSLEGTLVFEWKQGKNHWLVGGRMNAFINNSQWQRNIRWAPMARHQSHLKIRSWASWQVG